MHSDDIKYELLQDVIQDMLENMPSIEQDMHQLVKTPDDVALVRRVFRTVHTVKGNFTFCNANVIAEFGHHVEGVLSALREQHYACSELIAEAVLQALDCMREMAISLARTKRLGRVDPSHIVPYLDALASAAYQPQAEEAARRAIQAFGCELQVDATSTPAAAPVQHAGVVTQEDLAFFESMARAQEMRVPYWQGRIAMQMQLVLDMNEALGRPADPQQLAAAICWHDMGMLLLPDSVLLKDARYDEAEWGQIKAHPLLGSEWLRRMAIYDEAATMVAQHHERVDGNGYPVGLSGGAIHPGAQMIAIADAYFSMSNERSDREHKRSLLRTVAEINACTDSQFDGQVVAAFNQVIRSRAARPA